MLRDVVQRPPSSMIGSVAAGGEPPSYGRGERPAWKMENAGRARKKKKKDFRFLTCSRPSPLLRSARRHYVSLIKGTARCSMKNFLRNLRDEKIARFEAIVNASWSPLSLLFYNFIIIALSLSPNRILSESFSQFRDAKRFAIELVGTIISEGIFLSFTETVKSSRCVRV